MIFLSKEDKETWEKYKLNMHKLRLNIKKIETNSLNKKILVKDIWVFERKINYVNPNWTLIETKST